MSEPLIVELAGRSYPIYFDSIDNVSDVAWPESIWRQAGMTGTPAAVVTDRNLVATYPQFFSQWAESTCTLEAGEKSKSLEGLATVVNFFACHGVRRDGCVAVIGGGVVGDLGGFAAATWLRGVEFVQVPTTLLAMVDSSVGGKTGINLPAGKNLVGAFHQPKAVIISTRWLQTLPAREFAAGMAEVIKYGMLGDGKLFSALEKRPLGADSEQLLEVIHTCCGLKADIVADDERETAPKNGRALLNLGHTFAHAIEAVAGYGTYLHGEAVAIGLHAASLLSHRLGYLAIADVGRVVGVLHAHALPVRLVAPLPTADLLAAMGRDKKNRGGAVRFVVLEKIGQAATQDEVPLALAGEIFRELGAT